MRRTVTLDLTQEEWNALYTMVPDAVPSSGEQAALDILVASILRAVIEADLEEERKRAA